MKRLFITTPLRQAEKLRAHQIKLSDLIPPDSLDIPDHVLVYDYPFIPRSPSQCVVAITFPSQDFLTPYWAMILDLPGNAYSLPKSLLDTAPFRLLTPREVIDLAKANMHSKDAFDEFTLFELMTKLPPSKRIKSFGFYYAQAFAESQPS